MIILVYTVRLLRVLFIRNFFISVWKAGRIVFIQCVIFYTGKGIHKGTVVETAKLYEIPCCVAHLNIVIYYRSADRAGKGSNTIVIHNERRAYVFPGYISGRYTVKTIIRIIIQHFHRRICNIVQNFSLFCKISLRSKCSVKILIIGV